MSTAVPPRWFADAIACTPARHETVVDGATITSRSWGEAGLPPVVLVHGGGAHSGWWDHVGPQLAPRHHVVAVDLSGHGDSDRRAAYSVDGWAEEVMAVAAQITDGTRVRLVGHSMGAFVALRTANLAEQRVRAVVAIDPPVRDVEPGMAERRAGIAARAPRVYASRAQAESRWRPSPAQSVLPFVRDHVAAGSVRALDGGGWGWKFDPRSFDRPDIEPTSWTPVKSCVTVLRAEHGMLTPAMAHLMIARLGRGSRLVEMPGAGHHTMLDQPVALVVAMRRPLEEASNHELDGGTSR